MDGLGWGHVSRVACGGDLFDYNDLIKITLVVLFLVEQTCVVLRSEATRTVFLFPKRRAPARRRMGFLLAKETALFGTQWGPRKGDAKKPATANAVSIKRDDGRLPLRANPIQERISAVRLASGLRRMKKISARRRLRKGSGLTSHRPTSTSTTTCSRGPWGRQGRR